MYSASPAKILLPLSSIDKIDAIATKRFDAQTGANREVQCIFLKLFNQMDGFDQLQGSNAK